MGFVAQALHEIKHGIARFEHDRASLVGEMKMLAAGISVGSFGNADERYVCYANFVHNLLGDGKLPLSAVDQDKVGTIWENFCDIFGVWQGGRGA